MGVLLGKPMPQTTPMTGDGLRIVIWVIFGDIVFSFLGVTKVCYTSTFKKMITHIPKLQINVLNMNI